MSDFDVYNNDHLPPNHLLDELESIKGALDSNDEEAAVGDIPLLDDMVIGNLNANTKLLNLKQIFEEAVDTEADIDDAPALIQTRHADVQFPRFSLDTLLTDDGPEPIAPVIPAAPVNAIQPTLNIASTSKGVRPDYSREVLIQELVDEFIPQIEAALHERLRGLDDNTLQRLKERE
jgi:hypothetical protein